MAHQAELIPPGPMPSTLGAAARKLRGDVSAFPSRAPAAKSWLLAHAADEEEGKGARGSSSDGAGMSKKEAQAASHRARAKRALTKSACPRR